MDSDEFTTVGVNEISLDKAWVQQSSGAGEEACNYHTAKMGSVSTAMTESKS